MKLMMSTQNGSPSRKRLAPIRPRALIPRGAVFLDGKLWAEHSGVFDVEMGGWVNTEHGRTAESSFERVL